MFKYKAKKKKTYITIYTKDREVTYERGEIPIKEQVIIQKSIQFFNDPEPCYIHRGAVVMRLNEEIIEELKKQISNEKIAYNQLSQDRVGYIDIVGIEGFKIHEN